MDIKAARKILAQAEAAKTFLANHREKQLRHAYKQFDGFDSNAELIEALKSLGKAPAKKTAKAGKRTRTKITGEIVSKIRSLVKSGTKAPAIAKQVGISYATVLKAVKGQYDKLLASAPAPASVSKVSKLPKAPTKRRTNNVKLADLTDAEIALIKKAKSHKDILQLPKGSKNGGKNVMFAVYASIKGVGMRKTVAKKVVAKKAAKKTTAKKAAKKSTAKKVVRKSTAKKVAKKANSKK